MSESIYEYVLQKLEQTKGTWPLVAKETGMSLSTIKKIARREVADPGVSLIERLHSHFKSKEAVPVLEDSMRPDVWAPPADSRTA